MASLAISAIAAMVVMAVLRVPVPSFAGDRPAAVVGLTGGLAGVFITAALMLAPRLGAGAFLAAVIAGQMLALLLDCYALVGFSASAL